MIPSEAARAGDRKVTTLSTVIAEEVVQFIEIVVAFLLLAVLFIASAALAILTGGCRHCRRATSVLMSCKPRLSGDVAPEVAVSEREATTKRRRFQI